MSAAPKEYEHISFKFNKSSGLLDNSSFDVTAYLLVPAEMMPELRQWEQVETLDQDDRPRDHMSRSRMYKALKEKGALLHRTDGGPAYEEIQIDGFKRKPPAVVKSEYWEKGIEKNPADGPVIKSFGKHTL